LDRPDCVVTRGTSFENQANLAPSFFSTIVGKYQGTRLGRQELDAELLEDVPGALWSRDQIERLRRDVSPGSFRRLVVAIDPSGSGDDEGDECGVVLCGVDENDRGWVLVDASGKYSPTEWANVAVGLFHKYKADRIVAEVNFGGSMVESVIRAVDPNVAFTALTASRGKVARAEPISALYEQGRVHHGLLPHA
jgi:phage terminase large subunit-like protein